MRYFLVLMVCNLLWAAQFSGAKKATEQLGPVAVAAIPLICATVLLLPFMLIERRRAPKKTAEERGSLLSNVLTFAVLGGVGIVAAQLGLTAGVKRSLASNASVITLTIPVLMAFLAGLLLGEKMTLLRWLSFLLAIAGVVMTSDIDWRSVELFHGNYLLGNLLIFLSCWGSAFYNVFTKKPLERFTALEVVVYSFAAADLVFVVLMMTYEPLSWSQLVAIDLGTWIILAFLALFSLGLSMILYFWVIQRIDVTQASLSVYLLPVFGVLISAITLREKLRLQLAVGGLLVFLGTFLVTAYEERKKAGQEALKTPA